MSFAGEGGGALLAGAFDDRVIFCCVVFCFVVGTTCVAGGLVCVAAASAAHDLPQ